MGRKAMSSMPGCQRFGERLKYIVGHDHCNVIQERSKSGEPLGFRIGGYGMMGNECPEGQQGFLFLDSTSRHLRLFYFEIISRTGEDRFEQIHHCASHHGLPACTHLATPWLDMMSS